MHHTKLRNIEEWKDALVDGRFINETKEDGFMQNDTRWKKHIKNCTKVDT